MKSKLQEALSRGIPQEVADLIDAGADIHYTMEHGYDALIDAVHGRDVLHDPHLIELLTLLIENGVSVTGISSFGETAVRVLSRLGRFDAVQLLLSAGANPEDIAFTELITAVAFWSLADLEAVVNRDVDLEERDYWERTAWLVAIETGDVTKAEFLCTHGAQVNARGRCGKPPLFYTIENGHIPMLRWLLEIGADVCQTDDSGGTCLMEAVEYDNAEAVAVLLAAGVDVNQKKRRTTALHYAVSKEVAVMLLQAGADPGELSSEGRRAILGYPPDPDPNLLNVSLKDFQKYRIRRFGNKNPHKMNNPFWEGMIRSGLNAYQAEMHIRKKRSAKDPTWCADRFGQSLTFLPDGRIVQIAGEHEDGYDPDFCIYNDVFVHALDGDIAIYGYPMEMFSPTDFHTATLIGGYIYVIGSLGYPGSRQYGTTPVYRLDTSTFQMKRLETTGDNPGWIHKHRATLLNDHEIQVFGGTIVTQSEGRELPSDNLTMYIFDVETLVWCKL